MIDPAPHYPATLTPELRQELLRKAWQFADRHFSASERRDLRDIVLELHCAIYISRSGLEEGHLSAAAVLWLLRDRDLVTHRQITQEFGSIVASLVFCSLEEGPDTPEALLLVLAMAVSQAQQAWKHRLVILFKLREGYPALRHYRADCRETQGPAAAHLWDKLDDLMHFEDEAMVEPWSRGGL